MIASLYREGLEGIEGVRLPHFLGDHYFDSYQNYVIRIERRDELRQHLRDQGVETLVHWAKPMWEHKDLVLENPSLPGTESICREVISLPMSAETTPENVDITVGCIRDFFASRSMPLRTTAAR
jgi:dTDP-4-amino-4,6-dideoxygalactose transaminase